MKHTVKTIDIKTGKCLYEENFKTAERAYDEYQAIVKMLNARLEKGNAVLVARLDEDGYLMAAETIEGTK